MPGIMSGSVTGPVPQRSPAGINENDTLSSSHH